MKNIVTFFKEVGDEMKKVSWPKKDQLQESTIVTVLVCGIITIFVYVVDLVFSNVVDFLY